MEMVKNNNFVTLSNEELERVEGGLVPFIGGALLLCAGAVGLFYGVYKSCTSRK